MPVKKNPQASNRCSVFLTKGWVIFGWELVEQIKSITLSPCVCWGFFSCLVSTSSFLLQLSRKHPLRFAEDTRCLQVGFVGTELRLSRSAIQGQSPAKVPRRGRFSPAFTPASFLSLVQGEATNKWWPRKAGGEAGQVSRAWFSQTPAQAQPRALSSPSLCPSVSDCSKYSCFPGTDGLQASLNCRKISLTLFF